MRWEKAMAPHSSVLAWRTPWTEKPGRLQSMGSHRVGHDWSDLVVVVVEDEMAGWHCRLEGHEFEWTPGVGDGQGGLACCDSWGCKELYTIEWLNWTELMNAQPSTPYPRGYCTLPRLIYHTSSAFPSFIFLPSPLASSRSLLLNLSLTSQHLHNKYWWRCGEIRPLVPARENVKDATATLESGDWFCN